MSSKVAKIIVVTDEDTLGMILDYGMLSLKERDSEHNNIEFIFMDKSGIDHQLHFVHAEEV